MMKRKGIMMKREKYDYDDERENGLWGWERKGIKMMREKYYYDDERERRKH